MKAFVIMFLLSLGIATCAALYYRQDVIDFQAYTRKNLLPNLRGYGNDIAP
jgi:hypothetical protein